MSDSAAPSAAPSPSSNQPTLRPNAEPPRHGEPDKNGWTRPEPRVSQARETAPPKKEAPTERKETSTSEKEDTEKEPAKAKKPEPEDDDPEEEIEDSKGNKIKLKRSEMRKRAARSAEIERESHQRFQDSAKARKDLDAREQRLKGLFAAHANDPWAMQRAVLIERDGLTPEQADAKIDEIAEARLMRQMQRERLTPEQQEAQRLKDENAKLKADADKLREEQAAEKRAKLKAQHREQWDKVIGDTMTEHKLPPVRRTAARVAKAISDHAVTGADGRITSIPPAIAARIVRDEIHTEIKSELPHMFAAMPEVFTHELTQLAKADPAAVIALVGPDVVKAILAAESKKHRDFVPQGQTKQPAATPQAPRRKEPLTLEEARRKNLGVNHY